MADDCVRRCIAGNLAPCSCADAVEDASPLLHCTRRKTRPCRTLHPPITATLLDPRRAAVHRGQSRALLLRRLAAFLNHNCRDNGVAFVLVCAANQREAQDKSCVKHCFAM